MNAADLTQLGWNFAQFFFLGFAGGRLLKFSQVLLEKV